MPLDVGKAAPSANAGGAGAPGFTENEKKLLAIAKGAITGIDKVIEEAELLKSWIEKKLNALDSKQ